MDFFLAETFQFRGGKTCQLNKVLACDRFMIITVFMIATRTRERWVSLMNHITSCIKKADGLLSDEKSVRELFYESLGQWCEKHMNENIGHGFMANVNGKMVANACFLLSNKLLHSNTSLRDFFSGTKMSVSKVLSMQKESTKMIDELGKIGKLELNLYVFCLQAALLLQQQNSRA